MALTLEQHAALCSERCLEAVRRSLDALSTEDRERYATDPTYRRIMLNNVRLAFAEYLNTSMELAIQSALIGQDQTKQEYFDDRNQLR